MESCSAENAALLPTLGQLERQLGQVLQVNYRQWTGHSPSSVLCHVAGQVINLLIQDSITPLEKLLQESHYDLVRYRIHEEIRSTVPEIALKLCGVATNSIMVDSCLENGCTGIVIVLSEPPRVRSRKRRSSKKQSK